MSRRNLVWIAVVAGITVLFYRLSPMSAEPDQALRAYETLGEVDGLVRHHYVEPVDEERLVDGAIRGLMRKLDAYSGYVGPSEMEAFRRKNAGEFIGIGVEIGMHRGQVTVIAPIEGGPAAQAGVRPGDVLLGVDHVPTEDLTVSDVAELLRGPPGSEVVLTIRHRGREEVEMIALSRGEVALQGVKGVRRLGPDQWDYILDREHLLAYVRVSSFHHDTLDRFDQALAELRARGAQALVLDLRFNPGGAMTPAIDMVDRFVSEGVIVSTVNRRQKAGGTVEEYPAHLEDTFSPMPLVVLINGATASAAEIVAGSLQAHGRATVVGTRSFGKGCIQHVMDLRGHSAAIRLTVGYYQLPNGRIIHRTAANVSTEEWGVIPDVDVPMTEDEIDAIQASRRVVDSYSDFDARDGAPDRPPTTTQAAPRSPGILIDRQLAEAARVALGQLQAQVE